MTNGMKHGKREDATSFDFAKIDAAADNLISLIDEIMLEYGPDIYEEELRSALNGRIDGIMEGLDSKETMTAIVIAGIKRRGTFNTEKELMACPFCGEMESLKVVAGDGIDCDPSVNYQVLCRFNHGGCGAGSGFARTEEDAVKLWNTRAERMCAVAGSYEFYGNAGCEKSADVWELSCGHSAMNDSDFPPNYCPECGAKVVCE